MNPEYVIAAMVVFAVICFLRVIIDMITESPGAIIVLVFVGVMMWCVADNISHDIILSIKYYLQFILQYGG